MPDDNTTTLFTNPFGSMYPAIPRINFYFGPAFVMPVRHMPIFMPMVAPFPFYRPNAYGVGYQLGAMLNMATSYYKPSSSYNSSTNNYSPYSTNLTKGISSNLDTNSYLSSLIKSMPSRPKTMTFNYLPTKTNYSTNQSQTNSAKTKIEDEDSDLKPGLFKGKLAGKEALVTKICRKYGVSTQIVACIIGIETGWGTSNLAVNHNNFGGYRASGDLGKDANGHGYFSTVEKGLEAMIKNLASYPKRYPEITAVDWDNIDKIGRHYCESPNWADKVRNLYNTRVKNYSAIC